VPLDLYQVSFTLARYAADASEPIWKGTMTLTPSVENGAL
jgi:hypothetical protein